MSSEAKKSIIEEIEIHYYSPRGLKRHRYFIDSLERGVPDSDTPSGILFAGIRERDRIASGLLGESMPAGVLTPRENEQDVPAASTEAVPEKAEDGEGKKKERKFRSFKRLETLIYDDTALKQGELEDEAYDLLNKDGYYDEILPIDYDEEAPAADRVPLKTLGIYVGILLVLVGFIIWYVKVIIF